MKKFKYTIAVVKQCHVAKEFEVIASDQREASIEAFKLSENWNPTTDECEFTTLSTEQIDKKEIIE